MVGKLLGLVASHYFDSIDFYGISTAVEGPSLVLAREELAPFLRKRIRRASGTAKLPYARLTSIREVHTWGKHLILVFPKAVLRIHFLMFGSYRVSNPRKNRVPKLQFDYVNSAVYFYSCAIREMTGSWRSEYDWTVDLMSAEWKEQRALKSLRARPEAQVADVLLDQAIFAGLGNIMKNEILFNLKIHPETKVGALSAREQRELVTEAHRYAWRFYEWKKQNVLKRNWRIMRKKVCPVCGGRVRKRPTGNLKRLSHYCPRCQVKR